MALFKACGAKTWRGRRKSLELDLPFTSNFVPSGVAGNGQNTFKNIQNTTFDPKSRTDPLFGRSVRGVSKSES